MKKLVVLSGAGMSAESGLKTFREMGGLWEEYDVMEVASPDGFASDPELVLRFYNERRKQLLSAKPNKGHLKLAELELLFDVEIVTQNVDNLHEKAGSSKILHLHGELMKSESTGDPGLVYEIEGWELNLGDKCEKGYQLRPHVVWFGEAVPAMENAIEIVSTADLFLVVGTSLNVYPAAGLINYASLNCPIYLIDPNEVGVSVFGKKVEVIQEGAGAGMEILAKKLKKEYV